MIINKTILIIDDDSMLRDTLARGLRNENFNILTANSAEQGFEVLNRITANAIILDRMMTGMDGLSFLKQIRSNGDNTPVIMLTAMSGPENAIDGLSGGANDYLAKPFQFRELILRLHNIITDKKNQDSIKLPDGLIFIDDEFFIKNTDSGESKLFSLSGEEKKLLLQLISPVGGIISSTPMVAKRLRNKINGVLSDTDIITVRGLGYKLINIK